AFVTVTALTACSRKPEAEMQSLAVSRKDFTTAHDAKRLYGSVVEEYPLVYPEWEYGTGNEGCPYRFNGIKVQVSSESHIIMVSQREKLPNKGDSIVIHTSGLSVAHLGSVAGLPAYDISKLEYEVVKQKANNQLHPYSESRGGTPQG
ncbi:MAG: hypothetical protein WCO26_24965, partial [Deltaproteobacteria bacterium]